MKIEERINCFVKLGRTFDQDFFVKNQEKLKIAEQLNPWFTQDFISNAINSWKLSLTSKNLFKWLDRYDLKNDVSSKKILIIMAGNIPLVGFHDLMCALLLNHSVIIKSSSDDKILVELVVDFLSNFSFLENKIQIVDNVKGLYFDAVIATGSNNSSKYFEYYFKNKKRIIRKSRRSLAVLDGNESKLELDGLADDVFMYFGLGCRNVSKIFVPKDYDLNKLFSSFYKYKNIINHTKYLNNYDYHKSIYLMGNHDLIENGFLLMKEDSSMLSPVSMLFYEYYDNISEVDKFINDNSAFIQTVVSKSKTVFGESQSPKLCDYADGIDTIDFLLNV